MRWHNYETGKTVFARVVKGQRGQEFMRKSYLLTTKAYLPIRLKKLEEQLKHI
jgi:hypothetical protein